MSLVRELALDSSSCRLRKPHRTRIQLQLPRLFAGVEQDDRGGKTGKLHSAPRALHGPAQRAFHRRCSRYSHTEIKKDRGRWVEIRSQCVLIRTAGTAPQVLPPLAGIVSSLRPVVRERAPRCDLWLHPDREPTVRPGSVTSFLPRRPRGAHFAVLSSAACKVGRRIRQRGFLVGWYDLTLDPADLRRLRSDARSGCVVGAVLSPSFASKTSCRLSQTCRTSSNAWGQQPLSPNIQTGNQRIRRVIALIRELQKCSIPCIS